MNRDELRDWMLDFVADLLAVEPGDIDPAAPLESVGFDSAATLVLATDLSEVLHREVRPAEVLEHPSIEELSGYLTNAVPA